MGKAFAIPILFSDELQFAQTDPFRAFVAVNFCGEGL